jgi:hypothetical protein
MESSILPERQKLVGLHREEHAEQKIFIAFGERAEIFDPSPSRRDRQPERIE